MPKSSVGVNVNFNASPPSCAPDPVPVSKSNNSGVTWTGNKRGYTFTGVEIDNVAAPEGDFGTPVITVTNSGKSQMVVSDSGDTVDTDHKYTLLYTDPQGVAQRYDPTIRNNR